MKVIGIISTVIIGAVFCVVIIYACAYVAGRSEERDGRK